MTPDSVSCRATLPVAGFGGVSERYVTRERLAELMGVSVKTVDRLVARGMPSETWGLRCRRFLPSVAMRWAGRQGGLGA